MEKSLEAVGGMKSLAASFSLREERCQGMSCQPVSIVGKFETETKVYVVLANLAVFLFILM